MEPWPRTVSDTIPWSDTMGRMLKSRAGGQLPGALIFARENYGCAQNCPSPGVCNCAENERCELTQQTCVDCPELVCKLIKSPKGSVPAGAIAGASLGGLLVASVLAFFVWRSCVRKRSQRLSMAATAAEKENDFGMLKSARVLLSLAAGKGDGANRVVGVNAHRRIDRFHRPHASVERHPDRVHPRSDQPVRPLNARASGAAHSAAPLLRLVAGRLAVPAVPQHGHPVRRLRPPARILVHRR